ncbi:MAG: putative LPS assembly protein LptD [Candidatus Cloacimonetes bacterium]|nr:LPS-assembly protein LptD [Candidatus Cloacimonadota bacterium]MDD3236141.1 putative LPS assembly protein LptD [Candidatus Cloacimonadota bacterium]
MDKYKYLLVLSIFMALLPLFGQIDQPGIVIPDSLLPAIPDSLSFEKTKLDSLFYTADSIYFEYDKEQIRLYGSPTINYQMSEIIADSLLIDIKKERAYSYGYTRMRDGEQLLIGSNVRYDVNTQTGILDGGNSMMEKGYYSGSEIRKIANDVYDIDSGRFTSCDYAEPSYYFWAKKLRIYRGDKIVGKPVIAYVNHFPVFYFPFITIPIQKGRHPGFLIPEPGYNNTDGKYLRNIGWYYPYKDYADLILSLDLRERTGWRTSFRSNYLKRYLYSGGINATYQRNISQGTTNNDWSLQGNHHHDLLNKAALDVNLDFISNKRIWESSDDINQSLAQRLTSSVSYRKPIGSSYLNVGSVYTQDIINDRATISLPSASFNFPTRPVAELFSVSSDSWFSNLSYSYSLRFDHTGDLREPGYSFADVIWDNSTDPSDSSGATFLNEHHVGLKHNMGLSYNWKYRGWLSLREGIDYQESWMDRDRNDKKLVRGGAYSAYLSSNFNVYGVRNFSKSPIRSIRHILSPSVSLSYAPDTRKNSDLYSFGGIGISSSAKSASFSYGLDQKWQLKYMQGGAEKKLNDIITLSSRGSANLYKSEKRFGSISHSMNFRPGNISLGSWNINPGEFKLGEMKLGYSSQFSLQQNPYLVHWDEFSLRNQYFSQSISLGGSAPYKNYFPQPKNIMFNSFGTPDTLAMIDQFVDDAATNNNWSLSLTHNLYAPKDIFRAQSSNLRLGLTCKLTDNWSLSYSNYYNLKDKEMISQGFLLSRNLHCWKMDISINRRNEYWDYRIVLFNTLLPDALRFQTRESKKY